MRPRQQARRGFTLVELLVVIAIIAILAAIVIALFPSFSAQEKEARGGTLLQLWLGSARQKAQRNQLPYGLRLWVKELDNFVDPNTGAVKPPANWHLLCSDCQYIEQPDDYYPGEFNAGTPNAGTLSTWFPPQSPQSADFVWVSILNRDVTNGYGASTTYDSFHVQPGDYLELFGGGLVRQVVAFGGQTGPPVNFPPNWLLPPSPSYFPAPLDVSMLRLNTTIPFPITNTRDWRVIRKPRVTGDEPLQLPDKIVVDFMVNDGDQNVRGDGLLIPNLANRRPLPFGFDPGAPPPNNPPKYVDVVFSPSGAVITPGVTAANLNFYVRSLEFPYPYGGQPTIISVSVRTGFAAAYEVVPNAGAPFALVR